MNGQRIISFTTDDLIVDAESVTASLDDACLHRHEAWRVHGLCQLGSTVYFILLPRGAKEEARTHIFVNVPDTSNSGFVSLLNERWGAGFDIIGTFQAYETTMALFEKPPTKP